MANVVLIAICIIALALPLRDLILWCSYRIYAYGKFHRCGDLINLYGPGAPCLTDTMLHCLQAMESENGWTDMVVISCHAEGFFGRQGWYKEAKVAFIVNDVAQGILMRQNHGDSQCQIEPLEITSKSYLVFDENMTRFELSAYAYSGITHAELEYQLKRQFPGMKGFCELSGACGVPIDASDSKKC